MGKQHVTQSKFSILRIFERHSEHCAALAQTMLCCHLLWFPRLVVGAPNLFPTRTRICTFILNLTSLSLIFRLQMALAAKEREYATVAKDLERALAEVTAWKSRRGLASHCPGETENDSSFALDHKFFIFIFHPFGAKHCSIA